MSLRWVHKSLPSGPVCLCDDDDEDDTVIGGGAEWVLDFI